MFLISLAILRSVVRNNLVPLVGRGSFFDSSRLNVSFSAYALAHIQEYRLNRKRRWQRTLLEQVSQNLFFSWMLPESARRQRDAATAERDYFFDASFGAREATIATQRIPKREQFQIAVAEVARRVDDDGKLFAGEIFVANRRSDHRQILDHF